MQLGCLLLLLTLLLPTTAYFQWGKHRIDIMIQLVDKVHVKGRLVCGCASTCNQSISYQDVRLMEYDWGMNDNQINATTSDGDGKFELSGYHNEYWDHKFFLEVRLPCWRDGPGSFTTCKNTQTQCEQKNCQAIVKIPILNKYYYDDRKSMKPVDLGNIELVKYNTEHQRYLHSGYCPNK